MHREPKLSNADSMFPEFGNVIERPRYESQANLIAMLYFFQTMVALKAEGHFAEELATHRWYAKRTLRERFQSRVNTVKLYAIIPQNFSSAYPRAFPGGKTPSWLWENPSRSSDCRMRKPDCRRPSVGRRFR
jgi:hypothetical protein